MRTLGLTAVVLLACVVAAPSWAQPCKIARTEKGLGSVASAVIAGTVASKILIETGPFAAKLQLMSAAKSKGYSIKTGEQVAFYVFKSGKSVSGKDWRDAGSVATNEAGFAVEWPHLLLKGALVANMWIELTMGSNSERWKIGQNNKVDREGRIFSSPDGIGKPYGFNDLWYGEDELDAWDIWEGWAIDIEARKKPLVVKFTEIATDLKLATASFTYPSSEAAQARYVSDIAALRKAFAEKRCEAVKPS